MLLTIPYKRNNPTPLLPLPIKFAATNKIDNAKSISDSYLSDSSFVHLHNHSQFSVLQSTSRINQLVEAAAKDNMPAIALTDHGNLMGAFHFIKATNKYNSNVSDDKKIKPIVGCEFYVCDDHKDKTRRNDGYQIIFLAKNKKGYHNLAKLTSLSYVDGFYYVPRIDKKLVELYKQHLIVLTGNMYGEIPSKILNLGDSQAEEALKWWYSQFGDDFYIELMRHGEEGEDRANEQLIYFSKKYNIPVIATNNTYYVNKEEANAHDILLCVKEGEKQATPIGKGRGFRYGLPNQEYYFKTPAQMQELFSDVPQALESIADIIDKITPFDLAREVLLPKFDIPDAFQSAKDDSDDGKWGENAYLRHITYEGAKARYGTLNDELTERIDFELGVIQNTGYPGYFLIVQDFINAARRMNIELPAV